MAVQGSIISSGSLVTPGGDIVPPASAPLADTSQNGLLRQLSGNTTDFVDGTNHCQNLDIGVATVISQRTRGFNAIGNPNFEVDQRNAGVGLTSPATASYLLDRWQLSKSGSMTFNTAKLATGSSDLIPGTNYRISAYYFALTLTGQETSLAAGDYLQILQTVEGSVARALANDVSSVSILAACTNYPLKFGLSIRDANAAYSLVKLCTISSAGWNLIQLPNLPAFSPSGTFNLTPGSQGYSIGITLASGVSTTTPANDTWRVGNYLGAVGQDNFAAKPVNTVFQLLFVQHEPGPLCTTLIDLPFDQNYHQCLRYYNKSIPYATAPTTAGIKGANGWLSGPAAAGQTAIWQGAIYTRPLAKAVGPTIYSYDNGTASAVSGRGPTGTQTGDFTVNGVGGNSEKGFGYLSCNTAPTGNTAALYHYVADTGW